MEKRNKLERLKHELSPARFRDRLAHVDWASPDEADRFYLKNYGIYNLKIRPEHWMIRLRFDGGILATDSALFLADLARKESAQILLSARAQIELHGLDPHRVWDVWNTLNAQGLTSLQTLTDNARAIVIDPLDTLPSFRRIACEPLIHAMQERFVGRDSWIGTLPRKFNTALIGTEHPTFNPWGNDLLFALAHRDGLWGFNLYLGGKNGHVAHEADLFCLPEHVPDLFEAVLTTYREHGLRGSRSSIRLHHLITAVGIEQVRRWIVEHLAFKVTSAGTLKMRHATMAHLPTTIDRYGRYGEIKAETLMQAAQAARQQQAHLRLTPHQELWCIPAQSPTQHRNHASSHHPLPRLTGCAGARYCPLALWDIKADMPDLPLDALASAEISVGLSGCLKGCGRHYYSDIGLIGLRTNLYGPTEQAARVFIGALEAPEPAPARLLYYSVPRRHLHDLIRIMIEDFTRSKHASFAHFSRTVWRPLSIETLQLWYLWRMQGYSDAEAFGYFLSADEAALRAHIARDERYPRTETIDEAIRTLTHTAWDHPMGSDT
jgi:ferredoxin-nitrite reductase